MTDTPDMADTAVASAVHRLVDTTVLTPSQGDAVLRQFTTEYHPEPTAAMREAIAWSSVLSEIGGYVGAAFVLAAVGALVGPAWDHWSTAARAGVLAGPGFLLVTCAFVLASAMPGGWSRHPGGQTGPRRRLVSVLTLAAGGLLAGAVAVAAGPHADRVFPPALLALWAAAYFLARGPLLHLAAGAVLPEAVLAIVDPSSSSEWRLCGALLVLAGGVWATMTGRGLVDEPDVGLAVAGALNFGGAEIVVANGPVIVGYLLLAALAVVALATYVRTRRLSALLVGSVALAVVVPQAVIDYTSGSLGAAGALGVSGLSIVGVSALSLRLRRPTETTAGGTADDETLAGPGTSDQ